MAAAGNARPRGDNSGPPTFFRQGVLILAPVVLLAILGVHSLRQDAAFARQEAIEQAREWAERLAEDVWRVLTLPPPAGPARRFAFRVDAQGQLIEPPPRDTLPAPQPFDRAQLTRAQEQEWERLMQSVSDSEGRKASIAAARSFLSASPPERFAAAVHYRRGLLLAEEGETALSRNAFAAVAKNFPAARSDIGTAYETMARLKLVELHATGPQDAARAREQLEALCASAVTRPSSLTPEMLERAGGWETNFGLTGVVQPWRERWEDEETARRLFEAARPHLLVSRGTTSAVPRLVVGSGLTIYVETNREVQLARAVWFQRPSVEGEPDYFARDWLAVLTAQDTNGAFFVCYSSSWLPPLAAKPINIGLRTQAPAMSLVWHDPIVASAFWKTNLSTTLQTESTPSLSEQWSKWTARLPRHFGATLTFAGKPLVHAGLLSRYGLSGGGKGTGPGWSRLGPGTGAEAELLGESVKVENGMECLRVGVHLTGAQWLYEKGRSRTRWQALLILASAAVAIVGFVSARRAFTRQQRLAELQSNFVSSVSHELRAPMASVRLMAEALERGRVPDAPRQQEYFRFIGQECRRLSTMIENLLDLSRIEQGRREYQFEPADARRLVEVTIRLMEPAAAERSVRLAAQLPALEPGAAEPQVAFDALAVQQALVNLIDNALKHSPPDSEVAVTLEFLTVPGSNDAADAAPFIRLAVADQGPGVPVGERERIFDRFYRLGAELRRETPGVGLGLSIVKHIVQAHRGRVWVEDAASGGSRFVIELPASLAVA